MASKTVKRSIEAVTPIMYTNEAYSADVCFLIQEQHSEKCILKDMDQSFTNTNQISLALIKIDLSSSKEK